MIDQYKSEIIITALGLIGSALSYIVGSKKREAEVSNRVADTSNTVAEGAKSIIDTSKELMDLLKENLNEERITLRLERDTRKTCEEELSKLKTEFQDKILKLEKRIKDLENDNKK